MSCGDDKLHIGSYSSSDGFDALEDDGSKEDELVALLLTGKCGNECSSLDL
jgi:hypothetical protein